MLTCTRIHQTSIANDHRGMPGSCIGCSNGVIGGLELEHRANQVYLKLKRLILGHLGKVYTTSD